MTQTLEPIQTLFRKARNWRITIGGSYQSLALDNLIIHPNGKLYGELARMNFQTWRLCQDRLVFQGRNHWDTWEFTRQPQGHWVGGAISGPRLPAAPAATAPAAMAARAAGAPAAVLQLPPPMPRGHLLEPLPELDCTKEQFEIVVAKFREDVAWTDCYADHVTIYSKDPSDVGKYPILPNLGKDAGTQLYHIVERYDDLAERTLFLQGNPWDHPLLPIPDFATDSTAFTAGSTHENATVGWAPSWSKPPYIIDEPVMRAFLDYIGYDRTISYFHWTSGMQFAITREQLHQRSRDFYRRLYDLSQQQSVEFGGRRFDNFHLIFILELFWRACFLAEFPGSGARLK